jgi:hypothetical protein
MTLKKKPNEVFTPRNPTVNPAMYIERPHLERSLRRAMEGSQHILIHGESGCGKTWLYKRLLEQEKVLLTVANLGNASRLGSIVNEITNSVAEFSRAVKTGYNETKEAEINLGVGKGGLTHEGEYEIPQIDPLERAFQALRSQAGNRRCCLVLDNLESIFRNKQLMSELGDIILLVDDPRYARHNIKLLVVGVPEGVREYFSRAENRVTVTNRLNEIPEVGSLSSRQIGDFIKAGFIDELGCDLSVEISKSLCEYTSFTTGGVPQMLHEFCLELAYLAEDSNDVVDESMFNQAAAMWLQASLSSSYAAVEEMMNDRSTVAGRRNQVLYALGQVNKDNFNYSDIEDIVRRDFPASTAGKTLNISGILSELADRENSLIKRSRKASGYSFVDPKYRMCIRVMLSNVNQRVEKLDIRALPQLPSS